MNVCIWNFSEEPKVEPEGCQAYVGAPMLPVPCKFPFTYQGKEYHKCTKKDLDTGHHWCALDMKHSDSKWGHDCKECWKNETYKWGQCNHHACGLGEE